MGGAGKAQQGISAMLVVARALDALKTATAMPALNSCIGDQTDQGDAMAKHDEMVLYAAAYRSITDALRALDTIEELRNDQVVGKFDAAVIDKENGKPHIAKRMDRPEIRVIPEWFGGGTLPRKELHQAAEELTADEAGIIVVAEPTIAKALGKALTGAAKIVRHEVDAGIDEITSELQEALKS
jgi:hypothetical protein